MRTVIAIAVPSPPLARPEYAPPRAPSTRTLAARASRHQNTDRPIPAQCRTDHRASPNEPAGRPEGQAGRQVVDSVLFRSLLGAGQVDAVEVAVMPVLLGGGVPLLPPGNRARLRLTGHKVYPSGIASLEYAVAPPQKRKR